MISFRNVTPRDDPSMSELMNSRSSTLRIPVVLNPQRYVGLYIFDHAGHVSVGYTASEIAFLRQSTEYRDGVAYEIYRVNESGGFELRGVRDETLFSFEATAFLRVDPLAANDDFEFLRKAENASPLNVPAELVLVRAYDLNPPHVTALVYPASSGHAIAVWLGAIDFRGGDDVRVGTNVWAILAGESVVKIASHSLFGASCTTQRTAEEILASIHQPLQR